MLAVAPIVLALVLGVPYALRWSKSEYHAEASIYVSPTHQKNQQSDKEQMQIPYSTQINQQVLTIRRFDILSETIKRLQRDKGIQWSRPGESDTSAVARLLANLEVRPVPDSYEVVIGVGSDHQDWVAPIVNTIAETYLEKERAEELADRDGRFKAFQEARASIQKSLQQKLDQQANLSASLKVVSVSRAPDDALLANARQALEEAKRKRIEAEARLATMTATAANGKTPLTSAAEESVSTNDVASRTLAVYLMQRSVDLQSKIQGLTPEHPLRQATEKELASINAQLSAVSQAPVRDATTRSLTRLSSEVEQARMLENELQKQVANGSANVAGLARQVQLGEGLSQEIERLRKSLGSVNSLIEMSIQETAPGAARIFAAAQTPLGPLKNNVERNLVGVLALGALLGLALCVAFDQFDQRIRAPWEVQHAVGYEPLGVLIRNDGKNDAFADEQFWRLVNSIRRAVAMNGLRSLVFTPLHLAKNPPNLVANISEALNAYGWKTTIVNTYPHSAKPTKDAEGIQTALTTALAQMDSKPESSISRRDYPGSSSTDRMYDLVLVDGTSLLASSDMEYLGVVCDMTLIVVEAGLATRKELVRGADLLRRISAPSVGVVMTEVDLKHAGAELRDDFAWFNDRHGSESAGKVHAAVGGA